MLEAIIRVLAPHYCLGCEKEDTLLCEACRLSELQRVPSRCYRCKKLSTNSATCKSCRRYGLLENVWIGCEYDTLPAELIKRLKFQRARAAHTIIAQQLTDIAPKLQGYTISHIPTATTRVRQRGYDQSQLIAKKFAQNQQLPFTPLLVRIGQQRQVGAAREVRSKQAATFFSAKRGTLPDKVLLIDDVTTTGATIEAASRCLKKAGVKHVSAAIFAQKQ